MAMGQVSVEEATQRMLDRAQKREAAGTQPSTNPSGADEEKQALIEENNKLRKEVTDLRKQLAAANQMLAQVTHRFT